MFPENLPVPLAHFVDQTDHLLDVREKALHARGHPLFAANLPLGRIELDAYTRLPRRDAPIVTFDGGE